MANKPAVNTHAGFLDINSHFWEINSLQFSCYCGDMGVAYLIFHESLNPL
jgi:hypothetical protein